MTYKTHPRVQSLERKTNINQIAVQGKVTLQRQLVPGMRVRVTGEHQLRDWCTQGGQGSFLFGSNDWTWV